MGQPKGCGFDQLQEMIGLTKAKELIAQALDYYKAQKLFREKGIDRVLLVTDSSIDKKPTVSEILPP